MKPKAEAVIIGGGVHGCSIAYHMAKKGWKNIVLLEKGTLACGATGRSVAGIRHQFGTEINIRLAKESVRRMERLEEELDYDGSIELMQKGYLMLAYSEEELDLFSCNRDLQKKIDPENLTEILTPEQAAELVPGLNLEGLYGVSYNCRDGHASPFHVTQAYADAATRLGVNIRTGVEVAEVKKEGNRVTGVVTTGGEEISTPVVIAAAGAYTKTFGEQVGLDIPVTPERHQVAVTEPLEMILGIMVISFAHGSYFKQTPHGSLLLGVGDPEHEVKDFNERPSWQFLFDMVKKTTFHWPALREANIIRQWAGLYDMTPDSQGIVGKTAVDGFYLDLGWSGHGFQLAPAIGQVMAEIVSGETPFIDVGCMCLERFERGELIPEPACV